jgi:hypothetical protein
MSQENVEAFKRGLDAYNRQDVAAIAEIDLEDRIRTSPRGRQRFPDHTA